MQAFSENKADFIPLVETLALYFQIRDDYINLASASYMQNKSFCGACAPWAVSCGAGCWVLTAHIPCSEDITEGKFSFLAIYAIHNNPGDHRLLNILKQRTDDVDKKLYALAYLRESVRGPFSVGLSTRVPTRRRVLCVRRALSSTPVLCFVTSRPRL